MAPQSVARSQSIAAFFPALEPLIKEAMDEWKVPGLAIAVVQNGEVALLSPTRAEPSSSTSSRVSGWNTISARTGKWVN